MSLVVKALRGTAWTIGAYGVESAFRLVSNFILAQLFAREIFGLMALAVLVQQALHMMSDLGIGVSIVRHPAGDNPAYLNTAWTLQAVRGGIVWLGACALTWPMAAAYGQPSLLAIIPVISLISLIQGLQSTRVFVAQRDLDLGRITLLRLGDTALRFVVTITWALIEPSVWAIVGGAIVGSTASMIATHVLLRGTPVRFGWDRETAKDLFGFGRWVFISSALTFFAVQSDKLILGQVATLGVLGVYAVALPFAKLPHEIACLLSGTVLLPALASKARESNDSLRATFEDARGIILPAALCATIAVVLVAPWFFSLYKTGFQDAIWMAPMLSLCLWFAVLQAISDRALPALGVARPLAIANAVSLVVTATGCLVGYMVGGLPAFVAGVGLGFAAGYGVVATALARHNLPVFARDLRYTIVLLAGVGISFGPLHLVQGVTAPSALPAAAVVLLGVCLLGAGVIALHRLRLAVLAR